jgi:hypothetical protein
MQHCNYLLYMVGYSITLTQFLYSIYLFVQEEQICKCSCKSVS